MSIYAHIYELNTPQQSAAFSTGNSKDHSLLTLVSWKKLKIITRINLTTETLSVQWNIHGLKREIYKCNETNICVFIYTFLFTLYKYTNIHTELYMPTYMYIHM